MGHRNLYICLEFYLSFEFFTEIHQTSATWDLYTPNYLACFVVAFI